MHSLFKKKPHPASTCLGSPSGCGLGRSLGQLKPPENVGGGGEQSSEVQDSVTLPRNRVGGHERS